VLAASQDNVEYSGTRAKWGHNVTVLLTLMRGKGNGPPVSSSCSSWTSLYQKLLSPSEWLTHLRSPYLPPISRRPNPSVAISHPYSHYLKVGRPTAAVIRRTCRFRPSRKTTPSQQSEQSYEIELVDSWGKIGRVRQNSSNKRKRSRP